MANILDTLGNTDDLIETLCQVSGREERRAKAEFETRHGRLYDGQNDADWDSLDKSYTAVERAIDAVREIASRKVAA